MSNPLSAQTHSIKDDELGAFALLVSQTPVDTADCPYGVQGGSVLEKIFYFGEVTLGPSITISYCFKGVYAT